MLELILAFLGGFTLGISLTWLHMLNRALIRTREEAERTGWRVLELPCQFSPDVKYRRKPAPPKRIKFEAWMINGQLKLLCADELFAMCKHGIRLPALDLECEVQ